MAGSDFTVSMVLRAVNQMAPAIQQAASQIKSLQTQMNQLNATSNKGTWFDNAITRVDSFRSKLKTAQEAMDKLVKSGEKDLLTGGIMALPLVGMVKSASQVQNTQTSLELAGVSKGQVNNLTSQAQDTMRKTMFNTAQVLGIDRSLTQVGMDYSKIQRVGPSATYLAELEANRNGADPNETAKQFAQMSEQLGISMDPKKVNQLADMVNRISTITSASVSTLSDSSRYFNLVGRIQGLNPSDIMMTQGLAARFGLEGSIGGTNLKDFFQRLNPDSHLGTVMGAPIIKAFQQMGWISGFTQDKKGKITGIGQDVFHDSKGNLVSADKIFSILGQTYQKMGNREQFNALMTRIFGQQGQSIAAAVAQNPQAFATLQQQMNKVPGVDQGISAYQQTFNQQFHSFTSTLADFGRQVGTMLLPSITKDIQGLNAELPKLQSFIDQHKGLIKTLAEIWGGLTAFKIGSGVAKIAIGAPMREVFGLGRGVLGAASLGMRGIRGARDTGRIYNEFRQLGAGRMESLWAGIEHGHPALVRAGQMARRAGSFLGSTGDAVMQRGMAAGGMMLNSTIAGASRAASMMKSLGSATSSAASAFANVSVRAAVATARFIANGVATMAVKTAQLAVAAASRTWAAVQWAVNVAMDANPIGIIIVAVAGLVAGIVVLITHWKQVVTWVENVWKRFGWLRDIVLNVVSVFAPFIALPALIMSHWKGIESFFDGIGKAIGNVVGGVEHFLGIGGGSGPSTPIVARGSGGGNTQVIHNYNIQSTDPKQAANEVRNVQDKYYQSRYPIPQGGR